mmetsp:Transcript_4050/g.8664  ORF Transcript_4050/g.8664 Transcript_4050/m.8664 type:complete len:347 (+) Transcript_4050:130-1170(+)
MASSAELECGQLARCGAECTDSPQASSLKHMQKLLRLTQACLAVGGFVLLLIICSAHLNGQMLNKEQHWFDSHPIAHSYNASVGLSSEDIDLLLTRLNVEGPLGRQAPNSTAISTEAAPNTSSCVSPFTGATAPLRPHFAFSLRGPASAAWYLVKDNFAGLLSATSPEQILGLLAKAIVREVRREMKMAECTARPSIVQPFCNQQLYEVPATYKNKAAAAERDLEARSAYGTACQDPLGEKLLIANDSPDICSVVMSLILCQQALPPCHKGVYEATCVDTCILAIHCATLAGGNPMHPTGCMTHCEFPDSDEWPVWAWVLMALTCATALGLQIYRCILERRTRTGR